MPLSKGATRWDPREQIGLCIDDTAVAGKIVEVILEVTVSRGQLEAIPVVSRGRHCGGVTFSVFFRFNPDGIVPRPRCLYRLSSKECFN